MGPPIEKPYWLNVRFGRGCPALFWKKSFASSLLLRRNSYALPCSALEPDLIPIFTTARIAAEFRRIVVRLDAELLRRVDRRDQARSVHQEHRYGRAIDENLIGIRDTAVGGEVSPSGKAACGRMLHEFALCSYARSEGYKGQRVSPIQGKFSNLPVLDHLAQRTRLGIEQRNLPCHFHRLRGLTNFETWIESDKLLHANLYRINDNRLNPFRSASK